MTSDGRTNLFDLSRDELVRLVVGWGYPRFRAAQIWRWAYRGFRAAPHEMTNLPSDLQERVDRELALPRPQALAVQHGDNGLTEKVLLRLEDGQTIETVLMRYTDRNTLCVSSQVGCALGCPFCATGQQGWVRDLTVGEITAQVLYYSALLHEAEANVTNIVFMGMGEPLMNYGAVRQAIANLNDPDGLGLGIRRFTISTVGIVPGIERLAEEGTEVGLAVSLHAANDALRDGLVPVNRRYPLQALLRACRLYIEHTGRRITFEYALVADVNDGEAHALELARLLRGLLCHVNLIPLNPVPGSPYQPSGHGRAQRFLEVLTHSRIRATVRLRRGIDIQAGCGQLRGRIPSDQPVL